ncbi:RNA 2',3'-cyclic phosphodiesterase [Vibrio sp. PNB22_1_1]
MMRLFFALTFDASAKAKIRQAQEILAQKRSSGRKTRASNFHITLAFIGEATHEEMNKLVRILQQVITRCEYVVVDHYGSFRQSSGQLAWLGISENPELGRLQNELRHKLTKNGFITESHKYFPHITIARHVDRHVRLDQLPIISLHLPINSIALMESKFVGGKLVYHVIDELLC